LNTILWSNIFDDTRFTSHVETNLGTRFNRRKRFRQIDRAVTWYGSRGRSMGSVEVQDCSGWY